MIIITFAFEKGHCGNRDKEVLLVKLGETSQEVIAVI